MATFTKERAQGAPIVTPDNEEFWKGAAAGVLRIKRCKACGKVHWYPRLLCPHCMSDQTEWMAASGQASLYSFSVLRRGAGAPYAIAYVTLDEGVTLLSNVVDCDLDALRIGDRLRVVFKPAAEGHAVPFFTLA